MTRPPIQLPDRISHDFRTPLTVIKEYACIMRDGLVGGVSPQQRRMLNVIDDRADDIHQLVDDLLFLAEADPRALAAQGSPLDVRETLLGIFADFERKSSLSDCQLAMDWPLDLASASPKCFFDERHLAHAIRNVLSFAFRNRAEMQRIEVGVALDIEQCELQLSIPFQIVSDLTSEKTLRAVDLSVGLDVAEQLCLRNFGRLRVERDSLCPDDSGASITLSLPIHRSETVLSRYLAWFNAAPTANVADLFLIESALLAKGEAKCRTESVLRYAVESVELLLPLSDDSWLIVSPCCINRVALPDRLDALKSELCLDCDYALRQHRFDLQTDDILRIVEELLQAPLAAV